MDWRQRATPLMDLFRPSHTLEERKQLRRTTPPTVVRPYHPLKLEAIDAYVFSLTGSCWNITYQNTTITVLAIDLADDGFNLSLEAMNKLTFVQVVWSQALSKLTNPVPLFPGVAKERIWVWWMRALRKSTQAHVVSEGSYSLSITVKTVTDRAVHLDWYNDSFQLCFCFRELSFVNR